MNDMILAGFCSKEFKTCQDEIFNNSSKKRDDEMQKFKNERNDDEYKNLMETIKVAEEKAKQFIFQQLVRITFF